MNRFANTVRTFDESIEKAIEPWRSRSLDRLFYGLSSACDHGLMWLAISAARGARRGNPRWWLRFAGVLTAESVLTNGIVKSWFRRGRPSEHYQHDGALPYGMRRPITSSFPSGHAVTGFCAATLLSRRTRWGAGYFALAALVAASRVYTRIHHPSDVVAGAGIGLALGKLASRVLDP